MGAVKVFVICGLVAVAAWFASRPQHVVVRNEMVVSKQASHVYALIADLRKHTKYHQYVPKETELLRTETLPDGVELRVFRTREFVPIAFGYSMPVTFDAFTKLTEPDKELVIDITVGRWTKGTSTWTLKPHKDRTGAQQGTVVTEEFVLECTWILRWFVEERACSSHEELFANLKRDLER